VHDVLEPRDASYVLNNMLTVPDQCSSPHMAAIPDKPTTTTTSSPTLMDTVTLPSLPTDRQPSITVMGYVSRDLALQKGKNTWLTCGS